MTTTEQIISNMEALGFSNESGASIYKKLAEAVAVPIDNTVQELSNSKATILSIITKKRFGEDEYYTDAALAFQYGDSLVVDDTTKDYVYETEDTTKQIVKQAAFEELVSGQLYLKVATVDSLTNNVAALSQVQLEAFKTYFSLYTIPGLPVTVVSNDANVFSFSAKCTYYATSDLPTLKDNVSSFLTSFRQNFAFNGKLFVGDLQDYMKTNVTGIRDFYVYNTLIDSSPFSGSQSLSSGYFNYTDSVEDNISYTSVNG